jgi:high-affinity nickel-transport protein
MSGTVMNLASLLLLGFFLGMRHATDADHVIAIATIVSRQRSLRGSALIGAAWGVGHTLTILVVGSAIILFGIVIPARMGLAMELAVGVMLVLLGVLTLTGFGSALGAAPRPGGHGHDHDLCDHDHAHAHGDYVHSHAHGHLGRDHGHPDDRTPLAWIDRKLGGLPLYQWLRPLVIGIVHGLAGSAAIALLVLTAVREPAWAMAYLVLFGVGTIAGMMLITFALSAPFAFSWSRLPRFNWQLRVASGLLSFGFGLFLVYEIGFMDGGLFTASPTWTPH